MLLEVTKALCVFVFFGGDVTIKHVIKLVTDFLNFVCNDLATMKPSG